MLKALLKDSVVYGAANAVQKLVPLVVVPIVIHTLGGEALKVYDISFVYAALFSWLVILGQDAAASLFYFDEVKSGFNKRQVLSYAFYIQWCFLGLLLALLLPFKDVVAGWLFSSDKVVETYWLKALWIVPGYMLLNYVLNILLWKGKKIIYILICALQTVLSISSVYVSVVVLQKGLDGLFLSLIGSTAISALTGMVILRHHLFANPLPLNGLLIKKLFLFGVPFALTAFFHQAFPSIDRYFLLQNGEQAVLPLYILAVKLGGLIGMGISAFALAFTPYSMAKLNEAGAEKELSTLFKVVAISGFAAVPVLLIFKDVLVHLFANDSYTLSGRLLPFFFFGWLFDLFSYFSLLGIYKAQNSLLILGLFATGIVLITILNFLLVPRIGVWGAAVAFCATKAALFFLSVAVLRRHFKLQVHAQSFALALVVSAGLCYLLYCVDWWVYALCLLAAGGVVGVYLRSQFSNLSTVPVTASLTTNTNIS